VDFLLVAGFMNLILYQVHSFIYLQKQLKIPIESLNIINLKYNWKKFAELIVILGGKKEFFIIKYL